MPIYKEGRTVGWGQFLETEVEEYGADCVLCDVGLTADTYGQKIVYPGTVIARITGSNLSTYQKCIVKVTAGSPSYGPGSDVAYGLLRTLADVTKGEKIVHVVRAGRIREKLVTDQGTVGTVQSATKTTLSRIEWV